jgi:pyoverdine/dityrosine biosynthesis protein Dit1
VTERESHQIAREILRLVLRYQRPSKSSGCRPPCERCLSYHHARVARYVEQGRPVELVLPAFPGKSPNRHKVLGTLPDMAEWLSLEFLQRLSCWIAEIYSPGARIVICSDGRVFSDLVRIADLDITAYQAGIRHMLEGLHATVGGASNAKSSPQARPLELFNLDDEHEVTDYDEMRRHLVATYGEPLEKIQADVRAGGEPLSLYRGITRFLLDDRSDNEPGASRTALQKECRRLAYGVIQRSKAWGGLVVKKFPHALRLSIHPQACSFEKIGIHMLETADNWLTPWHGVAVDVGGRFVLMRRSQAEELRATLVWQDGAPSHYVAPDGAGLALHLHFGPRAAVRDARKPETSENTQTQGAA